MTSHSRREQWSSSTAFLLAITGASVGLGNLWRFPYIAGENGGGAFVSLYLIFILVIGVPLIMAELALGKRGGSNPVSTIKQICDERNTSRYWQFIGWFSILAPLLACTFYSVIAGWSLFYLYQALTFAFTELNVDQADEMFKQLLASPVTLVILHTLYLTAATVVVGKGIRAGIEAVTRIMMPLLLLLLILLAIYANLAGDARQSWHFLFYPDFSALTGEVILMALGQALFSVSVGTGAILAYSSYVPANVSIPRAAWTIGLVDTITALLAGLALFPILFAANMHPAEGPGLMFVTLPIALGNMPGGTILSILFFLLLFLAAFTSTLAMLEPFISWITERFKVRRIGAATGTGLGVWLVGLTTVFSFNVLKDFTPLDRLPLFAGRTVFSILDFLVSNLMLPINALMIALFTGWALSARYMLDQIGLEQRLSQQVWRYATSYLAPTALAAVFFFNI